MPRRVTTHTSGTVRSPQGSFGSSVCTCELDSTTRILDPARVTSPNLVGMYLYFILFYSFISCVELRREVWDFYSLIFTEKPSHFLFYQFDESIT